MVIIDHIPGKVKQIFTPLKKHFSASSFAHFWQLTIGLIVGYCGDLRHIAKILGCGTHRTNHGEFLWRSKWDESAVLRKLAIDMIRSLHRRGGGDCYLIIDDTQTLKRAKRMDGVMKLRHHATGKYGNGHTIFKVCLWYCGVIIPWSSCLYLTRKDADEHEIPFRKLTEMAADAIRRARLPLSIRPTVLFDSYYLCGKVARACKDRKWHFISVSKCNRSLTNETGKHRMDKYSRNVNRRDGRNFSIKGLYNTRRYKIASRLGYMNKIGDVKVVFSRRRGDRKVISLVTDNIKATNKSVVSDYLKRWAIEMLIKDEKQQLGLGDYRFRRYRAVVRYLHLVDCAYACLTRLWMDTQDEQGHNKDSKVLKRPSCRELIVRTRMMFWKNELGRIVKLRNKKIATRKLHKVLAA